MKRKVLGFTLIEVIVVISIVALLASLLFPVFARAKDRARVTTCLSNLSGAGKAIALYMGDADDKYPAGKDPVDEFAPDALPENRAQKVAAYPRLATILLSYTRSNEVFHCPSDREVGVVESQFPRPLRLSPSVFAVAGFSYEYHTDLAVAGLTGTQLGAPSGVNLLNDLGGHWHGSAPATGPDDSRDDFASNALEYRYNVLFADGHAANSDHRNKELAWRRG